MEHQGGVLPGCVGPTQLAGAFDPDGLVARSLAMRRNMHQRGVDVATRGFHQLLDEGEVVTAIRAFGVGQLDQCEACGSRPVDPVVRCPTRLSWLGLYYAQLP
ncbi:hypothetical protein D9M68_789130 [compost metagenome]